LLPIVRREDGMGWPKGKPRNKPTEIELITKMVTTIQSSLEDKVAHYLHEICDVPGCMDRVHLEDARNIIAIIKKGS
jgi:hypothetical protein